MAEEKDLREQEGYPYEEGCTEEQCAGCAHAADCPSKNGPESFLEPANQFSEIKNVIGVVSGKGGVGKSFVTGSLAVELAKKHGLLISVDPNLRKPLWKREEDAKTAIEWSLRQADIVKISDEEIDWLWGISPEEGAKKLLAEYGVSLVYATLGPKGCYAATQNCTVTVQSPSGIHAVDTTGAGDIFGGSAMSQFIRCGKFPSDVTEEDMTHIVRFACTAASLSTQKHGGITSVPDIKQIHSLLNNK